MEKQSNWQQLPKKNNILILNSTSSLTAQKKESHPNNLCKNENNVGRALDETHLKAQILPKREDVKIALIVYCEITI